MTMLLAATGGLLIGLSALLLYATSGRIAGISGIAFGALFATTSDRAWRLLFLVGLLSGAWLMVLTGIPKPLAALEANPSGVMLTVIAGLLVGAGTRLGNGCTSGHGVCGLARLSRRSLVAVLLFMGMGIVTASLLHPVMAGIVR